MATLENSILHTNEERHVITKKPLKEGDAILYEDPIAFGPTQDIENKICVGCCIPVDESTVCIHCGWPICSKQCHLLFYHTVAECDIFKKSRLQFQKIKKSRKYKPYNCVLPLRLLLLQEKAPDKWESVMKLEQDDKDYRTMEEYYRQWKNIIDFIRNKCHLKAFSGDTICKVCTILYECTFRDTSSERCITYLYLTVPNIVHCCHPNASFVISPRQDFRIFVRAAVDIPEGVEISISKVDILLPTLLRKQQLLLLSNLVSCHCQRCDDPTEFGTNLGSLECQICSGTVISTNPADFEAEWKCTDCDMLVSNDLVNEVYNDDVNSENNNDDFINKLQYKLHSSHAFKLDTTYRSLILEFDNVQTHVLSIDILNEKIALAENILNIFNIIAPGSTVLRGRILRILFKLSATKAFNLWESKEITHQQYKDTMENALKYWKQAEKALKIAEPFTDEEMQSLEIGVVESCTMFDTVEVVQADDMQLIDIKSEVLPQGA